MTIGAADARKCDAANEWDCGWMGLLVLNYSRWLLKGTRGSPGGGVSGGGVSGSRVGWRCRSP